MAQKGEGGPAYEGGRAEAVLRELAALGVHGRAVERPRTEEEAREVLASTHRDRRTVLPFGGGTALGVGPLPEAVDIVLDTTGMDRVLAFDPQNLNVAVLAGVTVDALNRQLAGEGRGFFLPLDPPQPERATIGGVYAANQSGPRRLLHGTVRDQALGVRCADAQGREIGFGGKTVKNVSGYDLTKFFVGSAGSLGLVTSVSFRVSPLPEASAVCELAFGGKDELGRFFSALRTSVLLPSAAVIADGGRGGFRALIGFEGHRAAVARQCRDLLRLAGDHGGSGEAVEGREALDGALQSAMDPEGLPEDRLCIKLSVPLSRGPEMFTAVRDLARQCALPSWKAALCAGSGVLTLHASGVEGEAARCLARGAVDLARSAGGHAAPMRAPRSFLAEWGPRVDPALERWVLRPIKERLDPTAFFPPIL